MRVWLMTISILLTVSVCFGQTEQAKPPSVESTDQRQDDGEAGSANQAEKPEPVALDQLEAPDAVREGNRLLRAGDAEQAMRAYDRAHELAPTAHEIDFDKGLAQFKLGDYEAARQAFENAALSPDDSLVDDAIYSVGNTYHAEALAKRANPQEAIPLLENAMQRYQSVLAGRKDHQAARDANYKAASLWRTLKRQLEQQQQQEQQQQDSEQDEEQQEDQEQQQQQSQQENQEQQDQQEQQSQDSQQQENQDQASQQEQQNEQQEDQQQSDEQQQQDEQSTQDEEQQQNQEPSAAQDQQQDQQRQQAEAQRQAEEERRQAERQLRDLMQELRQRNKRKPEQQQPIRPAPVEKDW